MLVLILAKILRVSFLRNFNSSFLSRSVSSGVLRHKFTHIANVKNMKIVSLPTFYLLFAFVVLLAFSPFIFVWALQFGVFAGLNILFFNTFKVQVGERTSNVVAANSKEGH